MPVEVTDNYVRVRQVDPNLFLKGSFRTIDISKMNGIKAVIGKRPGKDSTEIQTYLFDKDKWTIESAKKWIEEHKSKASASSLISRNIAKGLASGNTAMAQAFKQNKIVQDKMRNVLGLVSVRIDDGKVRGV